MKDSSMDLAKIAAGIVSEVMGEGLTARTSCSADGNSILMEFDGYPIYGTGRRGKVFVQFPRSAFYMSRGNVYFKGIQQAECRYYQEKPGTAFAHPHVFSSGQPCWKNGGRERAVDFIVNIVETLALSNVTKDSVTIGLCASGVMGTKLGALKNAQLHQKKVVSTLKSTPLVKEHRKLESFIDRRWCSKVTIYKRAA